MNVLRHALRGVVLAAAAFVLVGCCGGKSGKKSAAFGDACSNNLDCESMSCNTERGGICSKECHVDSECGGDLVCASSPTGTGATCGKKAGTATGGHCADRAECDHGPCLHKGDDEANAFCSMRCLTSTDCPASYKVCDKVGDMGAQKFCLPGDSATSTPPKIGVKNKKSGATPPGAVPPGGAPPPGAVPPGGRPPGPAKK